MATRAGVRPPAAHAPHAAFRMRALSHQVIDRERDLERRVLHAHDELCVARVTIPTDSALWDRPCETASWAGLAFPRRAIRFTGGRQPRVANRNHVVAFDGRAQYARTRVDDGGESTDVIWYSPRAVEHALGRAGLESFPGADRGPLRTGTCDVPLRRAQFRLFDYVGATDSPDLALVEEAGTRILTHALAHTQRRGPSPAARTSTHERHDAAVQVAIEYISCNLDGSLRLESIAQVAGYAPHHFCRVFRQRTGSSVHDYVHRLRLQTALQRSRRYAGRTVDLALDLGFASRSHLSGAFARWFGAPLSSTREAGTPRAALRRALDHLGPELD